MPSHPAAIDANKNDGVARIPIGISGDDAKYTLSGAKFIVVMLSSVLYKVQRHLANFGSIFVSVHYIFFKLFSPLLKKSLKRHVIFVGLNKHFRGLDLSRFPIFVLRHELSLGCKTLDPFLRVIAWSLNDSGMCASI